MPTAVDTLVSEVTALLHDAGNIRWSVADIISWLNAGALAVVRRVPAAYPKTADASLVAGTLQSIPSDGIALIRAVHNVSSGGAALAAPRRVSQQMMDTEDPNWHAANTDAIVRACMHDAEVPKAFWVSPPQPSTGTGTLRVQYSAEPPIAVSGGTIPIDKIYDNALINYALFRAFDRDAEDGDDDRAKRAFSAFEASLA
jgi:Family of unknown function (DUF6682)